MIIKEWEDPVSAFPDGQPLVLSSETEHRWRARNRSSIGRCVGSNHPSDAGYLQGELPSSLAQDPEVTRRQQQTDDGLIRDIQAQLPAALILLQIRYQGLVSDVAYKILLNWDDVQETRQDVFLQVWKHANRFDRQRGEVKGWIAGLARSRAIDLHRRNRRWKAPRDALARVQANGISLTFIDVQRQNSLSAQDEAAFLLEIVSTLPPAQERVVLMTYFMDKSQRVVAKETGQSLGIVKHQLSLAMRALKEKTKFLHAELSYTK